MGVAMSLPRINRGSLNSEFNETAIFELKKIKI